ncbi:uncharacterized protein LOC132757391 [Ruditapes philippinarum]|uniref:uncharacterized protein LOC132757391 n=1 Tax=Ruditapes philippinarum TaxID=129788 RepID=UPI00295AF846|nr:uncharacterized protein LOC132757391 [Ruditapes philippinarum]
MRSKTKPTIRKRKNRFKFFRRPKLNSRRKPLKISSAPVLQTHIGVICKNQRKKLALANREKLPLPTMNMSQTTKADGDVNRSKSLPTNIEKVLGSRDEQNRLTEATGLNCFFLSRGKLKKLLDKNLESCNSTYDDNQVILKSNTEIKDITKDNLNPELRKSLEKVRDLESKLNHEIHNGKVLKKTLQLQGDVNEVLKQNRQKLKWGECKRKKSQSS